MIRASSALLLTVLIGQVVLAGPPEGPSGRMVLDEVPQLRAEVKRLERATARNKGDVVRHDDSWAEDLELARARLATAEGRIDAARQQWKAVIASREERQARLDVLAANGGYITERALLRGQIAQARCGLAEVERDRATLVRELPELIDGHKFLLDVFDIMHWMGDRRPEETAEEEKAVRKELRKARAQLNALTRGSK